MFSIALEVNDQKSSKICVWSTFRAKLIEEVEKVQKRTTKILTGLITVVIHSAATKVTAATYIGVAYRRARSVMIEVF